jgi:hypothetical protein
MMWGARFVAIFLAATATGSFSTGVSPNAYTEWAETMGSKQYASSKFFFVRGEEQHKLLGSDTNGGSNNVADSTKDPAVTIHWTIDSVESKIRLAVAVKAIGWVGLGFTEMGGMPGSDMLMPLLQGHLKSMTNRTGCWGIQ